MSGLVYTPSRGTWSPAPASAATRASAIGCEVRRSDVDVQLLESVERTVRMASASLGIDAPRVRWLPRGCSGLDGITFLESASHEVWITLGPAASAAHAAKHEVRHTWQLDRDRWLALGLLTQEAREADCERFARDWRPTDEYKSPDGSRLQHKTSRGGPLEIKAASDGSWQLAGYASTFSPPDAPESEADSYGDLVLAGAFTASIAKRETKFLYEHREPIGKQLELKEDSHGLWGRWQIVDTQLGRDTRALVEGGVIGALSIGYVLKDAVQREDNVRLIKEAECFEVSATSLPANEHAVITDVRHVGGTSGRDILTELRQRRQASRVPASGRI